MAAHAVDSAEFKRLLEKHIKKADKHFLRTFIGDQISPKILEKAKQRIAPGLQAEETPMIILDTSPFFANLKCGIVATDQALYWRNESFPFSGRGGLEDKSKTYMRRYDELRSIIVHDVSFSDGRVCYLENDKLAIPMLWTLVGDSLISFLQIASNQKPLETEEEIEKKIAEAGTPKTQGKVLGYMVIILLIFAVVSAILWSFVANPRMLAPIGLGIVALIFASGRNAFTKLIDFIAWLGVTIVMWKWIMDGF